MNLCRELHVVSFTVRGDRGKDFRSFASFGSLVECFEERDMKQKNEPGYPDLEKAPLSGRDPIYSEDGVDLSLIRWMLSMTPTERLQTLQQNIRSIMRLRGDNEPCTVRN